MRFLLLHKLTECLLFYGNSPCLSAMVMHTMLSFLSLSTYPWDNTESIYVRQTL